MIIYKFPFGPLETNAILLGCTETFKAAVIDPAMGSTEALLKEANDRGLTIEKILLTHSHWDHFADAHLLKQKTHAPVYIHPLDEKNLLQPGSDGLPMLFPIEAVTPDGFFEGGDIVEIGNLKIEIIHCPGHSPGGVCFYIRDKNLLITGDTLFQGSIGNLRLATAEPDKMWDTLRKLSQLPPETHVIPGHGKLAQLFCECQRRSEM